MNCIDENAFNTMMSSPRKVPVLLIVDDIPYDSWLTSFNNKVSQDVQLFIDIINKYDLDGLIFDNLYPVSLYLIPFTHLI